MKHFSLKQLLIISIALFSASIFVFSFLYISIKNKQKLNILAEEEWKIEETRRENVNFLVNLLKSIEEEKSSIETHFVSSYDVVPSLDTLERLARESGNKPEVISVEVAKDGKSLDVGMKVVGEFESVYKYITLLENSPYELEFISTSIINMNSGAGLNKTTSGWSLALQLKLISFINKN